ncbi:helix-turn-helix domain-containing protein [Streptomyces sp. NPDC055078]
MPHGSPAPHGPSEAFLPARTRPEAITGTHSAALGLHHLPSGAADLVLLGDLTGRYATGSYTRLAVDRRSVSLRGDRQGASDHGHRVTAAIACHVARADGTLGSLTRLLLHPDHEGGRHVRNIALRSGHSRAHSYVQRVWASARAAVRNTAVVESRHHAYEDLAALRTRIETTPWRGARGRTALRVLRAHLNFAEIAGGRRHASSERQAAEEAGLSRQTLRNAYETVLKPGGWLHRLRVGHGTKGSVWYLGDGHSSTPQSRDRTTQCPPDPALEEWSAPGTEVTADIDSTVLSRLMGRDAFARHGLGSSALVIIAALHARPHQTIRELTGSSSVSRASVYRALARLRALGLARQTAETWDLAPRALEGLGYTDQVVHGSTALPGQGWDDIARQCGTAGVAAVRVARHAAERTAYREVLDLRDGRRRKATVIVREDGRQVLVPAVRGDEVPPAWRAPDGAVLDPATGCPDPEWRVASDGRLILITSADQCTYDELVSQYAEALNDWESAA